MPKPRSHSIETAAIVRALAARKFSRPAIAKIMGLSLWSVRHLSEYDPKNGQPSAEVSSLVEELAGALTDAAVASRKAAAQALREAADRIEQATV